MSADDGRFSRQPPLASPEPCDPGTLAALVDAAADPGFDRWRAMVAATGGCAEPIHLVGQSCMIHAGTGEVLSAYDSEDEPGGRLLVACGNRRRTRCPSCSETYRADTYQLIRAGLAGGKSIPETIAGHPKIFATFTAPSFGAVHHRVPDAHGRPERCHPRGRLRCGRRHEHDDPAIGQPLDPPTYDYAGAVIWNALALALWTRTTALVNRAMARLLGVSQRAWPGVGRVSVAKVAEYQARGAVHFHAILRLDGPEPGLPPPVGATVDMLEEAIRTAAERAHIDPPDSDALGQRDPIGWGDQLDLRPITNTTAGDDTSLSDGQVAGYVAKYATKGAEATGTIDHPICCRSCKGTGRSPRHQTLVACDDCSGDGVRENLDHLQINTHAKAMIRICWTLGGLPELQHLRLRAWAHMLGFRGHFSTKSRRYSTTLGCLRNARRDWRAAHALHVHGLDEATTIHRCNTQDLDELDDLVDDGTVLVVGHWLYAGRGHSAGQAIYAKTIADDIAENRRIWRQIRDDNE